MGEFMTATIRAPTISATPMFGLSRRQATYFLLGVVVFAAVLSALDWWFGDIGFLMTGLAIPILLIWALIVVALGIIDGCHVRTTTGRALATAGVPLLVVCLAPIAFAATYSATDVGMAWGDLAFKRSSYEKIIEAAERGELPPLRQTPPANGSRSAFEQYMWQTTGEGTQFAFERQSPHRFAFPFPGHFRHFYPGILFDPSGAQQQRVETSEARQSTDLLMVRSDPDADWTIDRCVHLTANYYRCTFYP
jgi:hypothetical protein